LKIKDQNSNKKPASAKKALSKPVRKNLKDIFIPNKYAFIIISVLTLITYSGSFHNSLVSFDDNTMMDNIRELKKSPINIFSDSFRLDAMAGTDGMFYRPFQTFILIALSFTGGHKSYIFFLLLTHILNACLLFYLMTLFNAERAKAFLLTLLFSVHPLFAPVINWIPSIGDASVTFFTLVSFIFILKYFEQQKLWFLVLSLTGFFFAVFSKEIALFIPVVIIIYLVLFKGIQKIREKYKDVLLLTIGWIFIVVVYLVLRKINLHSDETDIAKIGVSTFIFNIPVLFQFIFKFFLPVNLSLISIHSWIRITGGIILVLTLVFLAIKKGNHKSLIFSSAWFVLLLIPTLIFEHPHYDYLEHRGYLPLISLVFLLSSVSVYKYERIILFFLIPVFCILSFGRTGNFSDPIKFYGSVVKNEKVAMAYNNLAIEEDNIQDFQQALTNFNNTINLDPQYANAYINRGNLKAQRLNNYEDAISDYQKAIKLILANEFLQKDLEDYADIYNNMGTAKFRLNDIDGALNDYSKALEINPDFAKAYFNRGILKSEKANDYNGASDDFTKAIEIDPEYYEAYTNRGVIRETNFQDYPGALSDYNQAIKIKPDFALAFFNRGMYYKTMDDKINACKDWQTASNLGHSGALQMFNTFCR
jgi:tetratricopeptide (TPR) repeat protein